MRNPDCKHFTDRQKNPFLQRRLDYFFISDELQESISKVDVLPSLQSDHSPIYMKYVDGQSGMRGNSYWIFNNSLLSNPEFISSMKEKIEEVIREELGNIEDPRTKWEILKYRIWQFSSHYSKKVAKARKEKHLHLESEVQKFEKSVSSCSSEDKLKEHEQAKSELEEIYNYITEGIILRSHAVWYEKGEKSSRYFLTLEKKQKSKSSIRKLNVDGVEVEEQKQVLQCIHTFYRNLFKRTSNLTVRQCKAFINDSNLPVLTSELSNLCEGLLHSSECYQSLISMPSNKTPGNDGITKEFYVAFYQFIDKYFIDSANYSFPVGEELSPSQKQAVMTLLEKKDKDKRLIKNWRPICLLNVNAKIISKVLATGLEKVISFLVTSDQTAYIPGRFIGESVSLISDILDHTDAAQLEGYIFAADIEKAFDSVDHNFIIGALEAYGFGPNFVQWVKTLLYDQKSCVMNNGHSTGYFNLERGTRQGDPISAFMFALTIDIMVRSNVSI